MFIKYFVLASMSCLQLIQASMCRHICLLAQNAVLFYLLIATTRCTVF